MSSIDVSNLYNAILTAVLTIIGGIIIFVVGQFVEKFFITPLEGFRRTLGEISFNMVYFANIYMSPGTDNHETLRLLGRHPG